MGISIDGKELLFGVPGPGVPGGGKQSSPF